MRTRIKILMTITAATLSLIFLIGCHNDNTSVLNSMVADRNLGATVGAVVFTGTVTAAVSNAPVCNALVILTDGITKRETRSIYNGFYTFEGPLAAKTYTLRVEASGFNLYEKSVLIDQTGQSNVMLTETFGLTSSKAGSVSGYTLDGFGKGIPEVKVTLDGQTAYTNPNGLYFYANVTSGNHTLTFSLDGKTSKSLPVFTYGTESYANATLVMENDYSEVALQILDANNSNPVEGVQVIIEGSDVVIDSWYSDKDGMVYMASLGPKTYNLLLKKDGYYQKSDSLNLTAAGGETVKVIRIQPYKATLAGRVTDPATGLGLEQTDITVKDGSTTTKSDSQGDFLLMNIPPGEQTVLFRKTNFETLSMDLKFLPKEDKTKVEVNMVNNNPSSKVEGEFYTSSGGKYAYLTVDKTLISLKLLRMVKLPEGTSTTTTGGTGTGTSGTTGTQETSTTKETTTTTAAGLDLSEYTEVPIDVSSRFTLIGYRFTVDSLFSGIYKIKCEYVETVGTPARVNGDYRYNQSGTDYFILEEGKTMTVPVIMTRYTGGTSTGEVTQ
ncbi:MAG: carboxypeptidase-like regulatory domain-containing protein [Candidatus Wallbacteria bacterium]|nr:carboxypeptidase-like regulatory domain-containing protein [Candidatus Wallbacteria bacterium]